MEKEFTGIENGKFYAEGKEIGFEDGDVIEITDKEVISETLKDMEK